MTCLHYLCIIVFYLWDFLMVTFGNGRVFKFTLFKLGCLCWSVCDVAFNDETFFLIRFSKSIYKFGYRFIGQHIGYRLSNIKNYRYRPNVSYRSIPKTNRFFETKLQTVACLIHLHPFTPEDPLVKWWNTFYLFRWTNKQNVHLGWPEAKNFFSKFPFLS